MSFIRHFRRIQYIDLMILRKATGTPKRFAEKNRLSKSQMKNIKVITEKDLCFLLKDHF